MPTKILVTHRDALQSKYGDGWSRIERAIQQLIDADKARGITTTLVPLDDHSLGGARALKGDAPSFKRAVDSLCQRSPKPDYVVILGGPDVVPHQSLKNPIDSERDRDREVPSDLPYACEAPWADSIKPFVGPTRVVGRLPDLPNEKDPERLTQVLEVAATWQPRPQVSNDYFSIGAAIWKGCTTITLKALFGNADAVRLSPAEGPGWTTADMKPQWHFFVCHGSSASPDFYGQQGQDYPVSHQAPHVRQHTTPGTVVAAECCYGAELYDPRLASSPGICVTCLAAGAIAFVGSTNIAYGGSDNVSASDYLLRYFLDHARRGASLGRALLEARLEYGRTGGDTLSPVDLKTMAQFLLLGDPSLRAVAPTPFERFTSGKPALTAHEARRRILRSEAELAQRVPTADDRSTSASPETVRVRLEAEAAAAGYVPAGSPRAYDVRGGSDLPGAGTGGAPSTTRFHLMSAVPANERGPAAARDGARIADWILIVAREANGQITQIERLHARAPDAGGEAVFEGRVIKKRIGVGSRSEHDAVLLDTVEDTLELRRRDGNPFADPVLDGLVGRRIRGTGDRIGRTLILHEWTVLEDA